MKKFGLIAVAVIVLGACAEEPRTAADLARQRPDNIAIDGYSPVSSFTKGAAENGSAEFPVAYDGLTYWLTDGERVNSERRAAGEKMYE